MERNHHTTFQIDTMLRQIARPQLGLVTVDQALAAGIDHSALARRRDSGALVPMFARVMRLGSVLPTYPQCFLGAALATPGSHIAATSAGAVHQMPIRPDAHRPVVSVGSSRSARTAGVTTVRQLVPLPSRPWHGVGLAAPASTLLLLPRFVDEDTVERCLDHSLAHRLVSVNEVRELILAHTPRAVVGRAHLLDLLDARTNGMGHRSKLEQRVGRWLHHAGLTGWKQNHLVETPHEAVEVDFAWVDRRVGLEVSPFFTHGSREAQARDLERRQLLLCADWRIAEATDSDLVNAGKFAGVVAALRGLMLPRPPPTSRALAVARR